MQAMDETTAQEQKVYEHYKKIEAENFHLKNQLKHKHKEINELKRSIRYWKDRAKDKKTKQHYRNNANRRNGK